MIGRRAWYIAALAVVAIATCNHFAASTLADEAKDKEKKQPAVQLLVPCSATAGTTAKIVLRGQHLGEASEVRFTEAALSAKILSKGAASVPDKLQAAQVGDSQVEIEVAIPAEFSGDQVQLVVATPHGDTEPWPLLLSRPDHVTTEKESNGGFQDAQSVQPGQVVEGVIQNARDIDVFRIEGQAGQRIVAELVAARHGSPLDGLLTLHREDGAILISCDDRSDTVDPRLEAILPATGVYYISLLDAHDLGSALHQYRLSVRTAD